MENNDIIKLSPGLGITVAKELRDKYGIDKWKDGSITTLSFTKEELSKIQKIEIANPREGALIGIDNLSELRSLKIINPNKGDLASIENLPNLKSLSIEGTGLNEYTHPDARRSIDDADITSIEKCMNLETLSMINQPNVTDIDLSRLTKLEDVSISNNMNLERIYGIDKLQKLSFLTCYGNNSLQDINDLDKTIVQNKENLLELNLDVLLFPQAIKYNSFNGSYNQEALSTLDYVSDFQKGRTVKWCENICNCAAVKIGHYEMLKMHNKACQILSDVCPRNASIPDTVVAVERYLAQNVIYDDDSLSTKHTKYAAPNKDGLRMMTGHKYGSNGAYECLMDSCCVCEGYTRGEQYLLSLKGIKTRNVACIGEKDTMGMSDHTKKDDHPRDYQLPKDGYHSIIYIYGYYGLYSDPCWNACRYQKGDKTLPYSLLTKEEISKDHMLSFEERAITGSVQTISRSKISESIEYNTLFRNSRASEVAAQRSALGQNVIGIVRGADGRAY